MDPTSEHHADSVQDVLHSRASVSSTSLRQQRRALLDAVNRYEQDALELPNPLERLLGLVRADLCRDASELESRLLRLIAEAAPASDLGNLSRGTFKSYLSATRRIIRGL